MKILFLPEQLYTLAVWCYCDTIHHNKRLFRPARMVVQVACYDFFACTRLANYQRSDLSRRYALQQLPYPLHTFALAAEATEHGGAGFRNNVAGQYGWRTATQLPRILQSDEQAAVIQ